MKHTFKDYLDEFDAKYHDLERIDRKWYETTLQVKAFCSAAPTRDTAGAFSEEYLRARFVYAMVHSGMYQKEYICVEFGFPKGNTKTKLKPDIAVFKTKDWYELWLDATSTGNFSQLRQQTLLVLETKKNNKTVEQAIESQLRSAMAENESEERIFGVYFDDQDGVLIFKKAGNSELRRFYEDKEIHQDGIVGWNLEQRDTYVELPTQQDFVQNNESISNLSKLTLDSLDAIDESIFVDLMNQLKRANDSIRPITPVRSLIVEFLTLKVFDEKRSQRDDAYLDFYILPEEKGSDGLASQSFRERISNLYDEAQREYPNVLGKEKRLFKYDGMLRPERVNDEKFLIALVEVFQRRGILRAKHESFNQIIFNNFGDEKEKADNGQFFTPIPVVRNIIRLLNPQKGEELCDPCCGICDFPAVAFRHAHQADKEFPPAANNLYGFDLHSGNLKLAELNLVLNGDGGAVLQRMNSLSQKLLHNGEVMNEGDFTTNNYDPITWKHLSDPSKDLKKYKLVATNPPFGKGRDLKTGAKGKWDLPKETITLYETYTEKSRKDDGSIGNLPNSMDMGVLFLENAYKILEDGGRMAIVLSNSIASIKEWSSVRKWFFERMRIVAVFDLPANTFGETGVATTVIVAYKPKPSEGKLLTSNYEIFTKEIRNIGYEVKTKDRTVHFSPKYAINEKTFEKANRLEEDFTDMQSEYQEFMKRQEEEIKKAFHFK